eukprot:m.372662 g.372662  ORF g.372662 m.372662 type:complete len:59 (-) comp63870_c0_seq1:20-196(-)
MKSLTSGTFSKFETKRQRQKLSTHCHSKIGTDDTRQSRQHQALFLHMSQCTVDINHPP